MFDRAKFDRIASITEQLLDRYANSQEAQDVIRDNLLILVDMIFDEFIDGVKKKKHLKEYIGLADELYRSIVEQKGEVRSNVSCTAD